MATVRHLKFSKFTVYVASIAMLYCFHVQTFIEIGQSAAEVSLRQTRSSAVAETAHA